MRKCCIHWAKAHPAMGTASLPWPARQTPLSAGYDLAAAIDKPIELGAFDRALVPLGFKMVLPPGWEAQIRPRSGLSAKSGLDLIGAPGTIDADYRGEVMACAFWAPPLALKARKFTIVPGMRIAQMIIARVPDVAFVEVADLDAWPSSRGSGGHGSTGTGAAAVLAAPARPGTLKDLLRLVFAGKGPKAAK